MPKKNSILIVAVLAVAADAVYRLKVRPEHNSQPEIRVLGEDSSNLHAISALVPDFTRRTGIKVDIQAEDYETAGTPANTDLSQRTGRYDIVLQYNFSLSPYIRNRYVDTLRSLNDKKPVDLNWRFESALFENVWREVGVYFMSAYTVGSRSEAVAYPFSANTILLVTNRRLYQNPVLLDAPEAAQAASFYLSLKPYNAGGFLNVSATEQRQINAYRACKPMVKGHPA